MTDKHPLSEKEFWEIYRKVPRLTVEIIIKNSDGVLLTLRAIEPYKGLWHLPGGTVRFGETLVEAVSRIAARELGIDVQATKLLGYIEYPSHFKNGLDTPVGIAFEATQYKGDTLPNEEAQEIGWFKKLPEAMYQEQKEFLRSCLIS